MCCSVRGQQTLVNMGLAEVTKGLNTGYMWEEETITLFNGTFNSTQVLHKAGGIGVEQERALILHVQYDGHIDNTQTLTDKP